MRPRSKQQDYITHQLDVTTPATASRQALTKAMRNEVNSSLGRVSQLKSR